MMYVDYRKANFCDFKFLKVSSALLVDDGVNDTLPNEGIPLLLSSCI